MNKKINKLTSLLGEKLGLYASISIGLFIFILFFQPFPLERFDINNMLIFIAGFATIVFLILFLVRIMVIWLIIYANHNTTEPKVFSFINSFFVLSFCSVAFAFYLRYVGFVDITFYITFKIVIICLIPAIAARIDDTIIELKQKNNTLIIEKRITQKQIEKYEEDYLNKSIDFTSESNAEVLSILIADVVFIKSADNYVEIIFREGDLFKKKLIRNTLKNLEFQIKPYSNFLRCHRTCIVNLHFIEKLNSNYGNHWITVKGYQEHIPVSRQYLLKLKESF